MAESEALAEKNVAVHGGSSNHARNATHRYPSCGTAGIDAYGGAIRRPSQREPRQLDCQVSLVGILQWDIPVLKPSKGAPGANERGVIDFHIVHMRSQACILIRIGSQVFRFFDRRPCSACTEGGKPFNWRGTDR